MKQARACLVDFSLSLGAVSLAGATSAADADDAHRVAEEEETEAEAKTPPMAKRMEDDGADRLRTRDAEVPAAAGLMRDNPTHAWNAHLGSGILPKYHSSPIAIVE